MSSSSPLSLRGSGAGGAAGTTGGASSARTGVCGVGGALAGVGGVFMALLFTLAPAQIYSWFGVVLAAVLLGGLGSPMGLFAAGLLIGVSEALTMALTAPAWAPAVPFTILIVILVLWPERL